MFVSDTCEPQVQDGPNQGQLPLWSSHAGSDTMQYGVVEVETYGLGKACRAVATEPSTAHNFSADLDVSFSPAEVGNVGVFR